jgi:hypothetical protein
VVVLRVSPKQAAQALQASEAATNKFSRSHDAVMRVYDEKGNVIETHEHAGDFKEC